MNIMELTVEIKKLSDRILMQNGITKIKKNDYEKYRDALIMDLGIYHHYDLTDAQVEILCGLYIEHQMAPEDRGEIFCERSCDPFDALCKAMKQEISPRQLAQHLFDNAVAYAKETVLNDYRGESLFYRSQNDIGPWINEEDEYGRVQTL
jgi:hypothetical protein